MKSPLQVPNPQVRMDLSAGRNSMELKICTVVSYGKNPGESYRVTVNPANVLVAKASESLVQRQGMSLYRVKLRMSGEDEQPTLYINSLDLKILEEAVGFFGVDD